jgi:excinuclease ABC subunit C
LREKAQIKRYFIDIKGIGEASEIALLHEFKTISNIKKQPVSELAKIIGSKRADILYRYFHEEDMNE